VVDTGPDRTAEQRGRAFDRFHTARPGGTGLGLAIVRELAEDDHAVVELHMRHRRARIPPERGHSFPVSSHSGWDFGGVTESSRTWTACRNKDIGNSDDAIATKSSNGFSS
jgi:hypothetical protein